MRTRLPSLNSVRVFEAAARHGSFVKAADELCVTHGAVSRQIKQLEASLGLALFERRNRAVFLTRAGLQLHEVCRDVMQRLEDGLRQLHKSVAERPLVVSCEPTVAMRWLIPRLGRFHASHPEVQLLYAAGCTPTAGRTPGTAGRNSAASRWPKFLAWLRKEMGASEAKAVALSPSRTPPA